MRRGDVVEVLLDPVVDGEAGKLRPCIIVSSAGVNAAVTKRSRGVITCVPVTSNVSNVHVDFQVEVGDPDDLAQMGLRTPSKVQAEQVRAIGFPRITRALGVTPGWILHQVDDALRFHLSL
ncbi:type II toxin-antitoxin system PemK/MazF family toxin [Leifsonia shinshuensis]|nr:type II toxin-antitoxin system PemK/MazF family toxin [Leifsonia shinshuensis]